MSYVTTNLRLVAYAILYLSYLCRISSQDFCSLDTGHVFCNLNSSSSLEACGPQGFISLIKASQEDKKEILRAHNEFRNNVARGAERRGASDGGQPPASNMQRMYWDDELERAAVSTASKCILKFSCVACLELGRFQGRELMFRRDAKQERHRDVTWPYVVAKFYLDDLKRFNKSFVRDYSSLRKPNGYAYMVDATTNLVGCAKIHFKDGQWHSFLAVCTYGPVSANQTSIYEEGPPCSRCPREKECLPPYSFLCSDVIKEQNRTNEMVKQGGKDVEKIGGKVIKARVANEDLLAEEVSTSFGAMFEYSTEYSSSSGFSQNDGFNNSEDLIMGRMANAEEETQSTTENASLNLTETSVQKPTGTPAVAEEQVTTTKVNGGPDTTDITKDSSSNHSNIPSTSCKVFTSKILIFSLLPLHFIKM